MNKYPRESVEFQPVTVLVNDAPVTTGVKFMVTAPASRPVGTWVNPTTVGAQIGVMVTGYAVGVWHVWAQVSSTPETVVVDCGTFVVS